MPVWIIWLNITCHKSVVLPFRLCLFRCKRNLENILHYGACLGWPENSVKWKMIFIDRKISSLKREREREREPETWTPLPIEARRLLKPTTTRSMLSPPSRSNSRHLDLVAAWSLPPFDRSRHLNLIAHDRSRRLDLVAHDPWPISLFPSIFDLSLPPSLSLTKFFSLMNFFEQIFVSLSIYIEIFYYKICLEAEKMWETNRKIAF